MPPFSHMFGGLPGLLGCGSLVHCWCGLSALAAYANSCALGWGLIHCPLCWAGAMGPHRTSACASSATCMLFMMRDIWSLNALPCSLCGIITLLCSALLRSTMQLFMWQHDIVGVAHYIMDCFDALGALSDAPDDASTSSSSALAAE